MANNSFAVATVGEIRLKPGAPTTSGVTQVLLASSENRQVSTLNGAFKIQPYTPGDVATGLSQVLFDSPIVDADGNTIVGYISSATVAALLALWNA